ncbi:MAG: helix-turn-helix domain-containing protein [Sulfurovaceae bacterium]|nr:helix-turn-helix domain-containing protein [Sulfurovaceae bacterium]
MIIDADAHKIQSQVLIFAFSLAAEIERDLISERTKSALKAKKASGVILGRPKGSFGSNKLDKHENDVKKLLAKKINYTSIAKIYDCSRTTVENFVKKQKIQNEKNIHENI